MRAEGIDPARPKEGPFVAQWTHTDLDHTRGEWWEPGSEESFRDDYFTVLEGPLKPPERP